MERIIYYKTLKSYIAKWVINDDFINDDLTNYNEFDNPLIDDFLINDDNYNKYLRSTYSLDKYREISPSRDLFIFGEVQAEKYIKETEPFDIHITEYLQFKYLKIK